MKIKLKKNKKIKRWDSYKGFTTENASILNSGGIVEIDEIPEIAKDLVEPIGVAKSKSKEDK